MSKNKVERKGIMDRKEKIGVGIFTHSGEESGVE